MPRRTRNAPGGLVYHALNRASALVEIFSKPSDYEAFEQVLDEAVGRVRMRLLAYCLMPDHWHLVLWPVGDGDLSRFMQWLTVTHVRRWHAHRRSGNRGSRGHLYRHRFKSFPIQADDHFLTVCRYVERSALRANLVRLAEDWRWCSLWRRQHADTRPQPVLSPWPVDRPPNWQTLINEAQTTAEVEALRRCVARGSPYGSEAWRLQITARLGLESTMRPRGRPKTRGTIIKST